MSSVQGEPVEEPTAVVPFRAPSSVVDVIDLSLGIGLAAFTVASRVIGVAGAVVRPIAHLAMRPPLLDRSVAPETAVHRVALRGSRVRVALGGELEDASRQLVPAVADAVLDRIDLTELVIQRVDLVRIVDAVLDRIDLTELVIQRVDLDRVAAGLDVDSVAARLDLVGIANYVVDEIDLSEIIRVSTGSVATEAVSGVRLQSIEADAQLQRVVDRLLLRRKQRSTQAPVDRNGDDPMTDDVVARSRSAPADDTTPGRFASLIGHEPAPVSPIPRDALPYQGHRAGLVTRFAADAIDFGVLVLALLVTYASVATVLFLANPRSFEFPAPSLALVLVAGALMLGVYLTVGWWLTGRTYGKHVMGLRVLAYDGERLHFVTAALRAAFCIVFALGLFWVLVSRSNRSVQDVVIRSSVVYDWSARRTDGGAGARG